ncbi:hypothetical protein [Stenotrophomonas maltophilia]|uniref:hypothetical protein n=1 Tax=Stenotrophomonas maltophilia TaxID=40324 RepID=UPI0039C24C2D
MHSQAEPPQAPLPFHDLLDSYTLRRPVPGDDCDPIVAGDMALVASDYPKAAECYQSAPELSVDTSCKLGFALLCMGKESDATTLIDKDYCSASSNGTAVLAFVQHFGQKSDTLKRAVTMPNPGAYAKVTYLRSYAIWEDQEFALQLAEAAANELDRPDLLAVRARLLHSMERLAEVDLNQLLTLGSEYPDCTAAALHIAQATCDIPVGLQAIDQLLASNALNEHAKRDAEIQRTLLYMRHVGKTGSPDSISAARTHLQAALSLGFGPETHRDLSAVLDLQLRMYEGDDAGARDLAESMGAYLIQDEHQSSATEGMNAVRLSPYWEMVNSGDILDVERVSSIASDDGAWAQSQAIDRLMSIEDEEEPDPDDQNALVDAALARPIASWLYGQSCTAMIAVGRVNIPVLAKWLVEHGRAYGRYAEFPDGVKDLPASDLVLLSEHLLRECTPCPDSSAHIGGYSLSWLIKVLNDQERSDLGVALGEKSYQSFKSSENAFNLAYALHLNGRLVDAAAIYRDGLGEDEIWGHASTRNLALCYRGLRASPELTELARQINAKAAAADAGDEWKNLKKEVAKWLKELTTPPSPSSARDEAVQALFREYSSIKINDQPEAHQLPLGQAVALMALMRAGEVDHATWEIGPIKGGETSFDPTGRFLPLLGTLVASGLLGVKSVRNDGIRFDGTRASFDWDAVAFKLPPSTMDLHRSIRDLSREEWPLHWRQELETLSMSLATEECMAYMEHLAAERNLDMPADGDLRAAFVNQLQFAPVNQCWYFAFLAARATNDYRTKYRAGHKQIASYMLKRLRTTGESAQAGNWDNKNFTRIKALPRSLFAAALHDVFTLWGEAAFDKRIRDLIA